MLNSLPMRKYRKNLSKKLLNLYFVSFVLGIFGVLGFSSCQTPQATYASLSADGKFYKSIENSLNAPDSLFLQDNSSEQSINGTYPEHIFIKTRTQTFTKDYEFMIRNGKLLFKPKTENLWKLYCETGLPEGAQSVRLCF